ncbi:MAG: LicD family protein [Candidatus Nomurabacteria bacterium]|jgi:lipopolysaccharide cholinephosphotransferase|nr:LicD family protein [Candidatus Nomurabacteria bacterium]
MQQPATAQKITPEQVKEIQKISFAVFLEFKKIAEKHNLKYFIIGGTAIGALLYQDFIPWDDDIDLAMPRRDYDKLWALRHEFPTHITFANEPNASKPKAPYSSYACSNFHIVDSRCTYNNSPLGIYDPTYRDGIGFDVFPIDGLPDDKPKRDRYVRFMHNLEKLANRYRSFHFPLRAIKPLNRPLFLLGRAFSHIFTDRMLTKFFLHFARKYDFYDKSVRYCTAIFFEGERYVNPKTWWHDTVLKTFRKHELPLPIGYDSYLRKRYGDYTVIPPKTEQFPPHLTTSVGVLDLSTPRVKYQYTEVEK